MRIGEYKLKMRMSQACFLQSTWAEINSNTLRRLEGRKKIPTGTPNVQHPCAIRNYVAI